MAKLHEYLYFQVQARATESGNNAAEARSENQQILCAVSCTEGQVRCRGGGIALQ